MMNPDAAEINVEEVMRQIRDRVRQQSRLATPPATPPLPELSRLQASVATAAYVGAEIGAAPPSPATVRGRVGAGAVRIIQRVLAWYTTRVAAFGQAILAALREQSNALTAVVQAQASLQANSARESARLDDLSRKLEVMADLSDKVGALSGDLSDRLDALSGDLSGRLDALSGDLSDRLDALSRHFSDRLDGIEPRLAEAERLVASEASARRELETTLKAVRREGFALRVRLTEIERRTTLLLREMRKSPTPREDIPRPSSEDPVWSALYTAFEDEYRGPREEIKERARVYLPYLRQAGCGSPQRAVLDLGCGRGEWLELLRDEQIAARGVDQNSVTVATCREMGLDAVERDILDHLRSVPDNSLGAVTAFHVIEHLPWSAILDLFAETVRVLKTGGLAIFETPNPQNVLVSSHNFWLDPTHLHPLPATVVRFMAEARGLCPAEILFLHPYPDHFKIAGNSEELASRFNDYFYGPQDYAVIGSKP